MGRFSRKRDSNTEDSCQHDPTTGNFTCRRVRKNADGTQSDIAGFTMSVDSQCRPVASEVFEKEDGQVEDLQNKFVPRIIGKCQNTPSDY